MNETWARTLSRLVDDDDVDEGDLAVMEAALETSEGRTLLVQFAALRRAARHDAVTPGPALSERVEAELRCQDAVSQRRRSILQPFQLAAALVAGLLLGAAAGTWLHRGTDAPPSANRVLRFEAGEWTYAQGGQR